MFYLHACLCTICMPGAYGGQKRVVDSLCWNWSYRWLWATMQVLGVKPGSFGRAGFALKTAEPSLLPASSFCFSFPFTLVSDHFWYLSSIPWSRALTKQANKSKTTTAFAGVEVAFQAFVRGKKNTGKFCWRKNICACKSPLEFGSPRHCGMPHLGVPEMRQCWWVAKIKQAYLFSLLQFSAKQKLGYLSSFRFNIFY